MKNILKFAIFSICLSLIMILLLVGTVKADTNSFSTSITSDDKITPGGTVEILWKISEINITPGIISIGGVLKYDTNVFEEITDDEEMFDAFEGQNRWSIQSYNYVKTSNMYGTFLISRPATSYVKAAGNVAKITLKVKDNANVTSSTVRITDIAASGGMETGDVESPDVSITIAGNAIPRPTAEPTPTIAITPTPTRGITPTPTATAAPEPTSPVEPEPTPTTGQEIAEITPTPEITATPEITKAPTNSPTSKATATPTSGGVILPEAGESTLIIGLAFVAVVLGAVSFIRYKNIEKEIR